MFLGKACFVDDKTIDSPTTVIKNEALGIKHLIISLGNVKFLPIEVSTSFPQLETFSSTNGKFEEVSKRNFEKLSSLKGMALSVGELKKIEKDSFDDLTSLISLTLADNKIEYIHSKTLGNLKNLHILDIGGNQIEILHPKTFENLSNLRFLRLDGNRLITLDRQLFVNKTKLEEIHALDNNFNHIDEFTFDGLSLHFLSIYSDCRVGIYKSAVNLTELREDLRDNCKGSDFKITEIHARMMEVVAENEDEVEIY